jgi:hypothetical protein
LKMSLNHYYYASLYQMHDDLLSSRLAQKAQLQQREARQKRLANQFDDLQELPALSSFLSINEAMEEEGGNQEPMESDATQKRDGFERMRRCRMALEALDQGGWKRSYHQRLFHEAYIAACARPFWKLDPPGSFARAHQKILDVNNWDNLAQEILISTPRR